MVSFGGDTDFSGGIKVYVEPGQTYDIAVDGNVTLGGVSINADGENGGISSILSTRSIKFTNGSSMFFDRLQANCDIQLAAGAAGAELVYARNNICVANPKNPEGSRNLEVKANGSVYLSGGNWGNVLALAGQGEHQACPSAAEQYCSESNMQPERPGIQFGEGVNAYDITTHGFVDSQGTNTLKEIKSDQGLKVAWGTSFIRALLGGEGCIGEEKVCEKHEVEIATAALPQIKPVSEVEIQVDELDVNTLEPYANFVFSRSGKETLVRVRNVQGIDGGTYRLCPGSDHYLCSLEGEDEYKSSFPIFHGDNNSGALRYTNGKWQLVGKSYTEGQTGQLGMVPGLVIFEGDLVLSGVFINTFAATGNIRSTGNLTVYAPNYVGYDGLREGGNQIFSHQRGQGVCTQTQFPGLFPTTLCNSSTNECRFKAISGYGNYGLLAGSCKPGTQCERPENYLGGNIDMGAKNEIFGAIKAGGSFVASGSTTVHGYVSGLGIQQHKMGAEFTIDLTGLPEGYNPGGNSNLGDDGAGAVETETLIFWSRYL